MGALSTGLGAASSVAGQVGQANAYNANSQAAQVGYEARFNDMQHQAVQVDQQQSENTETAVINRARAAGAISASASSFGMGPSSTATAENAAAVSANRALAIQDINSESQRGQVGSEATSSYLQKVSQINSVARPSPLSMILGIGNAALGGADLYSKLGGHF